MKKRFVLFLFSSGALLLSSGWLDAGYSKRTEVDVDDFRHAPGREVVLTIDARRMEKATGEKFAADTVLLGELSADGKDKNVDFVSDGVDSVDGKMRLSFIRPEGKLFLYFGGKGKAVSAGYPDVLCGNALNAAKYRSDGFFKVKKIDGGINLRQDNQVRLSQFPNEILEQGMGPGVGMGLER